MDWLIGHLVGDYLLQNDWMALNKKKRFWSGELACNVHCLLWTLSVLVFTGWWDVVHFILVYLSHYILDRSSIVCTIVDFINVKKPQAWVYIVYDNVLHLLFLYLIAKYLPFTG
ncbi:DUF3307 domain-containing protein [Tumebacillus permanentifrigoris]|uniref:Uncharacterized protein DUF3307 n=1 Tax=Tumebacillus permanentifrigoris TaxID=378543 RepID=A0A316DWR8_9BACL|nr:DUF3307 domain-containing protein [Tumebacillus permanentifrigoris]PWK14284.1 uncharacterized protein DUF3307 [Tumebacillus permanentifrigoris]